MSLAAWALAFDVVMALVLPWVAWTALASRDLFRAVVLFIAFGLLLALVWTRLDAPDIALAEAAIGAGLTGALLLDALTDFGRYDDDPGPGRGMKRSEPALHALLVMGVITWTFIVGYAVVQLPSDVGLRAAVEAQLPRSGVSHPVTAVLLNFRAYDTLLEVGVLLLAVLGAWSLRAPTTAPTVPLPPSTVLRAMVQIIVPVMVLSAGYLLWRGSHAPGGAFQGGAVFAAALVLLFLASGLRLPVALRGIHRVLVSAGLVLFLAVAVWPLARNAMLLQYPPAHAKALILLVESALTVSIGVILALLFVGSRPGDKADDAGRSA